MITLDPSKTPIVIVNWNGMDDTVECVQSMRRQTSKDYFIYLVDNGSTDGSAKFLSEKYGQDSDLHFIENEVNLGFTRANNRIMQMILEAEDLPKYIVLLNNDTVVAEDWLEELVASAERHEADMVASKMVDYFNPGLMDNAGHFMLTTGEIISIGHQEPVDDFNKGFENLGGCGGGVLYATQMLKDIGTFDEYFTTGYEDAELGLRAVLTDHKCWYEPKALVYHKMGQSIKKVFGAEYIINVQKNIWYAYFKLMPISNIFLTIPSWIFKYSTLTLIYLMFWRMDMLKIQYRAIWRIFISDFKVLKESRRKFQEKHRTIGSWDIRRKQVFFLWFDIRRFVKYFILRKGKFFEKYQS